MTLKTTIGCTAIVCLALACSMAPAAPLFLQNFDGATWPPQSWSVTNTAGTACSWYSNSYWNDINYTGGTGKCAMISSTGAARLVYNASVNTPTWLMPTTATALELRFRSALQTWSGDETADVDISQDFGATWINVYRWRNVDEQVGQYAISMMPYLGKYIKVRFRYYNPTTQAWDLFWQIDDVRIVVPIDGDANKDDTVDVVDLLTLVYAFGTYTGDPGYDPTCDFNSDGAVDVVDLLSLVYNFGLSS